MCKLFVRLSNKIRLPYILLPVHDITALYLPQVAQDVLKNVPPHPIQVNV